MIPNDLDRINIERDGNFIKSLIVDTMKKYAVVSERWKSGTGGGSGFPENYENWEERDDELFANYDSTKGKHYTAWVYMVDKSIGFILNAKNDPVPLDVHLEDGQTPNSKSVLSSRSATPTNLGTNLANEIILSRDLLTKALSTSHTETSISRSAIEAMNAITQAESMKQKLLLDESIDRDSKKLRVNICDKTIASMYDQLESL